MQRFLSRNSTISVLAAFLFLFTSCGSDKPATKVEGETKDTLSFKVGGEIQVDIPDFWSPAADASGKYGYINTRGEWMIKPKYSKALPFSEGLAFVTETEFPQMDYYVINTKGEKVLDPEGTAATGGVFRFGVAPVGYLSADGKTFYYRFMDKTGKFLPTGNLASMFLFSPDAIFPVKAENGKFGFQDASGKWVIQPQYTTAPYQHENGVAAVSNEAGVGYINAKGKAVTAFKYMRAFPFSEGKSVFMDKSGRWGYVDSTGVEHYAPEGIELYAFFSNGLIGAKQGQQWGFMDGKLNMVIPPTYHELNRTRDYGRFREGLRAVAMGGKIDPKYMYIDTTGNVVLAGPYFQAGDFREGLAAAAIPNGQTGLFGLINREGKWAINPIFMDIMKFTKINETGGR